MQFSNDSLYQKMYAAMEHAEPSVFVESNDEGVERVLRSKRAYAFFMESTIIQYIIHTKCELTRVGENLDTKGYGIGLPISK